MDLSQLSDEDLAAVAAGDMSKISDSGLALISGGEPLGSGYGQQILDVAGRVLDYPGGVARLSAAGLANIPYAISTGESLTKTEDLPRTIKGQAPTTGEYLERAGVPEGPKVNLMPEVQIPGTEIMVGEGETSLRDVAGFAGDVALDPLTYLTLGGSAAAKAAAKVLAPTKGASEKIGKKLFKTGLKNVDEAVKEKGAKPISDVLWERGAAGGTTEQIQNTVDQLGKEARQARKELYSVADQVNVKVNPMEALKSSLEKVTEMRKNPLLEDLAEKLENNIQKLIKKGPVSLKEASGWKTSIRDGLPDSAFGVHGKIKSPAKRVEKAMASGLKNEIEKKADQAIPGLGKEIANLNKDWGSIIAAKKPLAQQAKVAKKVNLATSVDLSLLGLTLADPETGLPLLVGKKAGDILKTTGFRTMTGRGIQRVGKTGIPDTLLRRGLIETQTPWKRMKEGQ